MRPISIDGFRNLDEMIAILGNPPAFAAKLQELKSTIESIKKYGPLIEDAEKLDDMKAAASQQLTEAVNKRKAADVEFDVAKSEAKKMKAEAQLDADKIKSDLESARKQLEERASLLQKRENSVAQREVDIAEAETSVQRDRQRIDGQLKELAAKRIELDSKIKIVDAALGR